jgi:hypothetical protein
MATQTSRFMIGMVAALLLLVFLIAGAIVVKRRLVPVYDRVLDRRTSLRLIGALFVLATLSSLNSLPSQLSTYDTAEPWSTFLGTTALGFLEAIVFPLTVVALLYVLDALRRRLGIPMVPAGTWRSARTDILLMGLGLAGLVYAVSGLDALIPAGGMPSMPSTNLDELVPFLSRVPDTPATVIAGVAMLGIPILVVSGLTPRRSWRALIALIVVTLVAVIAWSFTPTDDLDPLGLALLILTFVVTAAAVRVWARRSAWAWFVAALFYQVLEGLRDAMYRPEWQSRVAGVLSVLLATTLIMVIVRRAVRRPAGYDVQP